MASQRRIVVLGGVYMDVVAVSDDLPGIGEYVYGSQLKFIPGGNGLNQAVVAARLGANAHFAGFIGDDFLGIELESFMRNEGVDTSNVTTVKGAHSGVIVYILSGTAERHLVYPGSNMEAEPQDMKDFEILPTDIVISQLAISQKIIERVFRKAWKAGAMTMLNLFPNYEVSKEVLGLSSHVILNEVELAFRVGAKEFVRAQHRDLKLTPDEILEKVRKIRNRTNQTFIVTVAERGAVGIVGNEITAVKGMKVKLVDATGAGDCFLGSFATATAEGMNFADALKFANCAAAISVQTIGTTTSFPKREAVDRLLKGS